MMNMLGEHDIYLLPINSEKVETNINRGLYAQIRKRQSKTQPIGTFSLAI